MLCGKLRRVYPNVLKLDICNIKTVLSLEEQENNLEKVKNKSTYELFNEFYKMQNNVDLDENSKEIIKEAIEDETNKIDNE